MVIFIFAVLLVSTSVKTIEGDGPTRIADLFHEPQRPFDYYSKIAHIVKRDTKQSPPESEQTGIAINQPSVSKPLQVQTNTQGDTKHVNTEQKDTVLGQSEGGVVKIDSQPKPSIQTLNNTRTNASNELSKENPSSNNNTSVTPIVADVNKTQTTNTTESALPINNPGVVKRGLIVFGGFALLAVAYFIFYRRKNKNLESSNTHGNNDANQFRYGVLQSDDRRDNLELSRIPLTMESDEEEDDDLEIFDLEQKKKSLSYVNLQTNDEDVIIHSSNDESKNNLLLDIEDGPSDTLINWSSNGNKSIL